MVCILIFLKSLLNFEPLLGKLDRFPRKTINVFYDVTERGRVEQSSSSSSRDY